MNGLRLGLIGYPVSHSLSPLIHNTWMALLGLQGEYVLYETEPGRLANVFQYLKLMGCDGVNLTVPFKVDALALLESHPAALDNSAQLTGAVNTVKFRKLPDAGNTAGQLHLCGYNTDVGGFWASLSEEIRAGISQRKILILGAGGAARAVVAALLPYEPLVLTLAGRSVVRQADTYQQAMAMVAARQLKTRVNAVVLQEISTLSAYDMIIQCTPVGLSDPQACPLAPALLDTLIETLPPYAFVYDLIYQPTALLRASAEHGLKTQDGLEMLLHQAAQSFEIWTGYSVTPAMLDEARQKVWAAK